MLLAVVSKIGLERELQLLLRADQLAHVIEHHRKPRARLCDGRVRIAELMELKLEGTPQQMLSQSEAIVGTLNG